ncbi:hypothetical protein BJ165DRAFT_1417196 [Panaeolus papilionaceus]|nr:hypothetical protein BJ165DRAFT_1417196 [Panaeolus papilionaceus]
MYSTPEERLIINEAEKLMVETMARYDPSHDKYHVYRVRKTALYLANTLTPTPDLLVIELAALLHDVLDKKYVTPEQAADPYSFFLPFFKAWKTTGIDLVEDQRAQLIAKIVDNVSWSTEKKRRQAGEWSNWHDTCTELHCVQDADRLDAIGAFGIMRCAAFSTVTNRPLHTPAGDPEQEHTSIQHFHDKLLKIRDALKTEAGTKMGHKRHQTLLDFLASVEEEYDGTC